MTQKLTEFLRESAAFEVHDATDGRLEVSTVQGAGSAKRERKPSAREILVKRGASGLSDYLEDNPNSPQRIQDEMRGHSLLGGVEKLQGGVERDG